MASPPWFPCPHCRAPILYYPQAAGQMLKCPKCAGVSTMPGNPAPVPQVQASNRTQPIPPSNGVMHGCLGITAAVSFSVLAICLLGVFRGRQPAAHLPLEVRSVASSYVSDSGRRKYVFNVTNRDQRRTFDGTIYVTLFSRDNRLGDFPLRTYKTISPGKTEMGNFDAPTAINATRFEFRASMGGDVLAEGSGPIYLEATDSPEYGGGGSPALEN